MKKTKYDQMVGTIVGSLTIEYLTEGRTTLGTKIYQCTCVCGNPRTAASEFIRRNKDKGCLCRFNTKRFNGLHSLIRKRLSRYKANAKSKNHFFELSDQEAEKFITSPCFYCGYLNQINGIDRKDNMQGYLKDNCVSCCRQCNFAKGTQGFDEFVQYLKRISKFFAEQS